MMYNKIFNPNTDTNVSIYSKLGKSIINNYLIQSGGVSGLKPGFLLDKKKEELRRRRSVDESTRKLVERRRKSLIKLASDEVNFNHLPPDLKNYIVKFLDDNNQNTDTRISNKCKNIARYCQINNEMKRHCADTPSIRQTIGQCKQHKVNQIKASRPFRISIGPPIDTVPKGKPVSQPQSMVGNINLTYKLANIENIWQLSKSLSVPLGLHRVADLLNVPKYVYISKTTGYVFKTNNDNPLLPQYGLSQQSTDIVRRRLSEEADRVRERSIHLKNTGQYKFL